MDPEIVNENDIKGLGPKRSRGDIKFPQPANTVATRRDPVTTNEGDNGGFRTGYLVFTNLWSYVPEINAIMNRIQKKKTLLVP